MLVPPKERPIANPGSSLPSSNPRLAPPPVERKEILSVTPAFLTALTEPPPPMMLTALERLVEIHAHESAFPFSHQPGSEIA